MRAPLRSSLEQTRARLALLRFPAPAGALQRLPLSARSTRCSQNTCRSAGGAPLPGEASCWRRVEGPPAVPWPAADAQTVGNRCGACSPGSKAGSPPLPAPVLLPLAARWQHAQPQRSD
eukprot:4679953-Prymnesium_polylepis.2